MRLLLTNHSCYHLETEDETDVDGTEVELSEDAGLQVDGEEAIAHGGDDEGQETDQ